MKKTNHCDFYDFINHNSVLIDKNRIKHIVGYYNNGLTAIKHYDYLDAEEGEEITEYSPEDIFTAEEIEQIENELEK